MTRDYKFEVLSTKTGRRRVQRLSSYFLLRTFIVVLCLVALRSFTGFAQVSTNRLVNAAQEPQNWLMYSGNYSSTRYSRLDKITPENVKTLELKWMYQGAAVGA